MTVIELLGDLTNPWVVVIDLVILLIVGNWLWNNAISPAWKAISGFVRHRDRQTLLSEFATHWKDLDEVQRDAARWSILREIADQFKPNGGTSLWDRITDMERRQGDMQADLTEIKNLIQIHIASRIPGGARFSDPPVDDEAP